MSYITGLCRAYTDYVIHIDDDQELEKWNLKKGGDQYANLEVLKQCISRYEGKYYAGGCIPNSLSVISALGGKSCFIGKVANDEAGKKFQKAFKDFDVQFNTSLSTSEQLSSALTVIFVSSDGNRSILFDPGVSDDVTAENIAQAKSYLLETNFFLLGMICRDAHKLDICEQAISYLPDAKIVSSIQSFSDMRADEIVRISDYILKKADIIFGNEDEFEKFIKANKIASITAMVQQFPNKTFIETMGVRGAKIYHAGECYKIPAFPCQVVDTTGAGDAFAGGFLHGLNQGYGIEKSGKIGSYCAALIIGQVGGRPKKNIILSNDLIEGVINDN